MNLSRYKNKWIEMIYLDSRNRFTQRTVYVRWISDSYMIAYCSQRKQLRKFKLENVLSALPMQRSAV